MKAYLPRVPSASRGSEEPTIFLYNLLAVSCCRRNVTRGTILDVRITHPSELLDSRSRGSDAQQESYDDHESVKICPNCKSSNVEAEPRRTWRVPSEMRPSHF